MAIRVEAAACPLVGTALIERTAEVYPQGTQNGSDRQFLDTAGRQCLLKSAIGD